MRLGIGSYTFTWAIGVPGYPPDKPMDHLALLEQAAILDVRVVQFCDNLPLDRLTYTQLDEIAGTASGLSIAIEVGTRGISSGNLLTHLRIAERLGSSIVRVVIDTADQKPPADEVPKLLRKAMRDYERAGVTLAIENHDRFPAQTLADIVELVGSEYLGVCLDTVNSFGALEGPEVVVATLAPWVVNLHVKDFSIRRAGHQMGFAIEGTSAGQGRLDVPWLLWEMRQAGRDPNAILELWTPPEAAITETIAKERAWAEESVEYLRTLLPE